MSDQKPSPPVWRFLFGGRPADEELAYRNHYLANDVKQIRALSFAAIGFLLALTLKDIPNLDANPDLMSGIIVRAVMMIIGVFTSWILTKNLSPKQVDLLVGLFAASVAVGMLTIHLLPSISGARMLSVGTLFIMGIHFGLPTYAATLALPVAIVIFGDWIILYSPGREHLRDFMILLPIIYLFAEYIAVVASAYHHRARFHAFKSLEQEMHLNAELRSAAGRINQLSGLLPICSNCKKIRNDQGYYQQIEQYITEHSEAEFTHGICPDCAKELYPDIRT